MINKKRLISSAAGLIAAVAVSAIALPVNADEPIRGGTLTASSDIQPKSMDPIMGDAGGGDSRVLNQMFETLVRFNLAGELEPALAESWAYSDDGASITFNLREGVKFHDGTMLDAEAVAYNLRRVIDPEVNAPRAASVADIQSIDVTGPLSVVVNFKEPSGSALASLASEAGMISSPAAIETYGEDYGRHPVGTGPFKFVSWVSDSHVDLTANQGYWRQGADGQNLPYLENVRVRFITEIAVKMIELQSGNVQLVDSITPDDFDTIGNDPNLNLIDLPTGVIQFVSLNVNEPPFDNELVRRAFSLGINRNVMMRAVTRGYGFEANGLFLPNEVFYDGGRPAVAYDPDLARELLAEAGYADGLSVDLSVIQRDPDTLVGQIIQQQLADIGINVNVEILERQAWIDKVLFGAAHQAAMLRTNIPRLDPHLHFGIFYGQDAPQNWSGIDDSLVFDLVEQARRSTDQQERARLYSEIEARLVDQAYYAFLFVREEKNAANNRLHGLRLDKAGGWFLEGAWLAE